MEVALQDHLFAVQLGLPPLAAAPTHTAPTHTQGTQVRDHKQVSAFILIS